MTRWSVSKAVAGAVLVACGCGGTVETSMDELGGAGGGAGGAQAAGGGSAGAAGTSGASSGAAGAAPSCTLAGPETFASAEAAWAIAMDSDTVYWADEDHGENSTLKARAKSGGPVVTLASYAGRPRDLALDDSYVFAAEPSAGLTRVPKHGGAPESLAVEPGAVVSVAIDATHLYYADATAGTIKRIPKQGGSAELLAADRNNPGNVALDDDSVYWIDEAQHQGMASVLRMNKGGGPPVTLAGGATVALEGHGRSTQDGLAIGSGFAVWVDEGGGAVHQVPVGGGAVTTLVSGLLRPTAVVVHGGFAYVAVAGGDHYDGRAIVKVAAAGGAPEYLVKDNQFVPWELAVDELHVYWTNPYSTGPVMRACSQ